MGATTVLLVEDDRDNRAIYQTILEHAGYRVLLAVNGVEGVALARQELPDMILMDLAMPEMDGWAAIRLIREDPRTASIPVHALSAHVLLEGGFKEAIAAGFHGYLTKPVEPKRVLQRVREIVGEP